MQHWIFAALVFFGYVLVLAPLLPGLQRAARWRASLAALGGLALSLLAYAFDDSAVLRQWVMPPALLLLGYWASGQLFAAPMPGIERALCSFDRNLRVDRAIVGTPHWLRTVLELAYAGVYVLVPIALLIRFATVAEPNPDGFWTIILVTDFVCFACLPWIQTRPPRALSAQPPWQSGLRRLNERVLASDEHPAQHVSQRTCRRSGRLRAAGRGRSVAGADGRRRGRRARLGRRRAGPLPLCRRRRRGLGRRGGCLGGAEVVWAFGLVGRSSAFLSCSPGPHPRDPGPHPWLPALASLAPVVRGP